MTEKKIRIRMDANEAVLSAEKLEEALQDAGQAADGLQTKVKPAAEGVQKAFSKMGRNAGQASIQVQQLVGQVAGGVNPLVAFSQQAADLGFVLGVPLVGAVVSVAASIPLLISAFDEGEKATETFGDKVSEAIKKFREGLEKTDESTRADFVRVQLDKVSSAITRQIRIRDEDIKKRDELNKLTAKETQLILEKQKLGESVDKETQSLIKRAEETAKLNGRIEASNNFIKQQTHLLNELNAESTKDIATKQESNRLSEEDLRLEREKQKLEREAQARKVQAGRIAGSGIGLAPEAALLKQKIQQAQALEFAYKEGAITSEQEFKERLLVLEQQFEERKSAIRGQALAEELYIEQQKQMTQKQTQQVYLSTASTVIGALLNIAGGSKKAAKILKVVQGGVNAFQVYAASEAAAAQILATPPGPILNPALIPLATAVSTKGKISAAAILAASTASAFATPSGGGISSFSGGGGGAVPPPTLPTVQEGGDTVQTLALDTLTEELRNLGSEPIPASFVARILEAVPEARQITGGG